MRLILILCMLTFVSSALATLSTMFPYFFSSRTTPTPPVTNAIRRSFTRRTDFFGLSGRKKQQRTKLSLQVSLGPMIFPESIEETTPFSGHKHQQSKLTKVKTKRRPIQTTTSEPPSFEEYQHESEEETLATKESSEAAASVGFMNKLKNKFPSIHDWLFENESESSENGTSRSPRMPRTFFALKPKQEKAQKLKAKQPARPFYKPPKSGLIPPKKLVPPRPPQYPVAKKPARPHTAPYGKLPHSSAKLPNKRPKFKKPGYEQYPAVENPAMFRPDEDEEAVLPGGQFPVTPKQEVSRELFFYEPPKQFAPSRPKPYQPKPPVPPKKEYKVIFIKAPEPEPPIIPNFPQLQPAPEQKTLIYVVAKKPEDRPNITVPLPARTPTEKPDVFFIRYKVTTTTPVPDESEQEVLPGGQFPTKPTRKPYRYPKPTPKPTSAPYPEQDESEEGVLPGGQFPNKPTKKPYKYPKPTSPPQPIPDESEEEILPAGQYPTQPPDEYLPPAEEEDEVFSGGQEPEPGPGDEYLPPDEDEEEVLPGGQEPSTEPTQYLPPVDATQEVLPGGYPDPPKECEEGTLPGSQLEPPKPGYGYLPPLYPTKPPWQNQYLPQPEPYGVLPNSNYGGYSTASQPPSNNGGYGGTAAQPSPNYGGYGNTAASPPSNYGGYAGTAAQPPSNYGGYGTSTSAQSNYGGYPNTAAPSSNYGGYSNNPSSYGLSPNSPAQNSNYGGYINNVPPNTNYGSYSSGSSHQSQYFSPVTSNTNQISKFTQPQNSNNFYRQPKYTSPTNSNYGSHNAPNYASTPNQNQHGTNKNLHTVLPPRHLTFPIRYNENGLHRQGTLDENTSLDSILFQSLGLAPVQ